MASFQLSLHPSASGWGLDFGCIVNQIMKLGAKLKWETAYRDEYHNYDTYSIVLQRSLCFYEKQPCFSLWNTH